jgi:O-antigen ligase
MEIYLVGVILILLPLAKLSLKFGIGFRVKEGLFYILSFSYICYMLLFGFKVVDSHILYAMVLIAMYSTFSVIWSTNVEQSWQDIIKWWALVGLFIMVSTIPVNTLLIISVIPIPFILAWGILQQLGYEPFDKTLTKYNKDLRELGEHNFRWSMGNLNHAAAFLAPYLFIAIYLTVNVSTWFAVLIPMILYGVYSTRCYTAMAGMFVGLCVIYPKYSLWMLSVIPACMIALLVFKKRYSEQYKRLFEKKIYNLTSRFYYWLIAFNLWKKRPIFGWGMNSFSKETFECQAEMNESDPSLLGYKDEQRDEKAKYTPYPERAHNDLVEMLSDGGIIGFILLAGFMGTIIYSAIVSGNYILLGGLICLMVHGCMFYTLSSFSYIPYILLAACVAQPSDIIWYAIPLPIAIIGVLVIAKLCINRVIKAQMAMVWMHKSVTVIEDADADTMEGAQKGFNLQNEYINKAINLDDVNGHILHVAVTHKMKRDKWLALHYAERAIHLYDGTMRLPELFARCGELQMWCGNIEGAKKSLNYALYLNPRLEMARKVLAHMNRVEREKINKQALRLVKPDTYLKEVGVK